MEKKKRRLKTLNSRIVSLQKQLKTANDAAFQQSEKLQQKNQQLTNLLNQLEKKNKLVDDLQSKVKNLESQRSFEVSDKEKQIEKLERKLKEKDKIITMLKKAPPLAGETNIQSAKDFSLSSEKDLLGLVKYHQKEVQRLKRLIEMQARTMPSEVESEVSLKETVQNLPKKNSSALYLSLLGVSLMVISLCVNLLKNKLRSRK